MAIVNSCINFNQSKPRIIIGQPRNMSVNKILIPWICSAHHCIWNLNISVQTDILSLKFQVGGRLRCLRNLKLWVTTKHKIKTIWGTAAEDIDHDATLYFSSSHLQQVISSPHDSSSAWETCTPTIISRFSRYAWTLGVLDYELIFLALALRGLSRA
jgi:hypothetical protein